MKGRITIKIKQVFALILLGTFALTLLSCGEDKPENIIFPEKEYRDYIKKARAGAADLDQLFTNTVNTPVKEKYGATGWFPYAIRDIDALERNIDAIVREDVVGIIYQTLEECFQYFPSENVKIFIMPLDPKTNYGASGGLTPEMEIYITVNPSYRYWKELIPYMVAHEYLHYNDPVSTNWKTLLEILIAEGKADSFAQIIDPDAIVPWHKLMVTQEELNRFRDNLYTTNPTLISELMWQLHSKDSIDSSGNSVGYQIVQAFIRNNPEVSITEWAAMAPDEILEKSGYDWEANN